MMNVKLIDVLTDAEDCNEDAVDHELPDGGPDIDLLVHIDRCHLPGAPHSSYQIGECVPTSLGRLSISFQQWKVIITGLCTPRLLIMSLL